MPTAQSSHTHVLLVYTAGIDTHVMLIPDPTGAIVKLSAAADGTYYALGSGLKGKQLAAARYVYEHFDVWVEQHEVPVDRASPIRIPDGTTIIQCGATIR